MENQSTSFHLNVPMTTFARVLNGTQQIIYVEVNEYWANKFTPAVIGAIETLTIFNPAKKDSGEFDVQVLRKNVGPGDPEHDTLPQKRYYRFYVGSISELRLPQ